MLYLVKNITGDSTSQDPELVMSKSIIYADEATQTYASFKGQETVKMGEREYLALKATNGKYITLVDQDATDSSADPYRIAYTITSSWAEISFAYPASKVEIYSPAGTPDTNFSFGGFTAPDTQPKQISLIKAGETLKFESTIRPFTGMYVKGTTGTLYIIVS